MRNPGSVQVQIYGPPAFTPSIIHSNPWAHPPFRMLLTPGTDPVSRSDHFHFEARVPGDCVEIPPPANP